jgi:hypothetical protein
MTQNLTRRTQNMTHHDAKNNARITRNNAGVAGRKWNQERARPLYLGELRLDMGSGAKILQDLLVNTR